jgi:hypothetical protein
VLHVFCSWGLRDSLKGREEVTNKLGGFPAEYTRYLLSSYILTYTAVFYYFPSCANYLQLMKHVTMVITRILLTMRSLDKSTIRPFFAGVVRCKLPTLRRVHPCLSTMTNSLHYFWRIRLSMNWQLIKPSRRHDILRNISSPIQS